MPFSCGILETALEEKVKQEDWELYKAILPWMKETKSFEAWRKDMRSSSKNNSKSPDEIRKKVKEVRKRLG